MLCPITSPSGSKIGNQASILSSIMSADVNFTLWQRNISTFLDIWSSGLKWEKTEVLEGEFDLDALDDFEDDLFNELKNWRDNESYPPQEATIASSRSQSPLSGSELADRSRRLVNRTDATHGTSSMITPPENQFQSDMDYTRWIAADMCSNIKTFMNATNAQEVFVKIEPVADDMCQLFHVDYNMLRMLCTYVGEGTLWLPNDKVERKSLGRGRNEDIVLDPLAIFQAPKLDVLILKGSKWPNNLVGGAVHRSPQVREGERRILFKVDFIC